MDQLPHNAQLSLRLMSRNRRKRLFQWSLAALAVCGFADVMLADIITFGGNITQSTSDGTGPAGNNPALNSVQDADFYKVTLDFATSITAPGAYDLTGAKLRFSDAAAAASESSFGSITLTITANGGFDDISLLGCLTSGACLSGNQLGANFRIPAVALNLQDVPAVGLDPPHPLDLLEDDGTTDIQGSITTYSYTSVSPVPEPSSLVLMSCALAALVWRARREIEERNQKRK